MNTLELGKYWSGKLRRVLPLSSSRIRTRLAWRLAALSVETDENFAQVGDDLLMKCQGGTPAFLELRRLYFRCGTGLRLVPVSKSRVSMELPAGSRFAEGDSSFLDTPNNSGTRI